MLDQYFDRFSYLLCIILLEIRLQISNSLAAQQKCLVKYLRRHGIGNGLLKCSWSVVFRSYSRFMFGVICIFLGLILQAGFLPFSAIYIELHYIFASVWGHKIYTLFGILFLAYVMLIIVSLLMSRTSRHRHFVRSRLSFALRSPISNWRWKTIGGGGVHSRVVVLLDFSFMLTVSSIISTVPTCLGSCRLLCSQCIFFYFVIFYFVCSRLIISDTCSSFRMLSSW